MRETLISINSPKSFKNIIIPTYPDTYTAFLYEYLCLDSNRRYVGVHKGYVGDGYFHSSTNDEFIALCANPNANLQYQILAFGNYDEMTVKEHKILKMNNATQNPKFFNKSNGSPKYKVPDYDKIHKLVSKIESGYFDNITNEDKLDLYKLPKLQVRTEQLIRDLYVEIAQKINDAGGDTTSCDPILIFEKRLNNTDIIGNGSHTLEGAYISTAKTLKVSRVPKNVHKLFSDSELRAVSNLLNRRPKIVKVAMKVKDAEKYILGTYIDGYKYDSEENKIYLNSCGFTNKQIPSILKNAKKDIDNYDLAKSHQVFIDYKSSTHKSKLEYKCEGFRDHKTLSTVFSSGYFRLDRLMYNLYQNQDKKNIVIVIYHKSLERKTKWQQETAPDMLNQMEYWLKPLGYTYRFEEMECTMPNRLSEFV